MDESKGRAALADWVKRLQALGYEGLREGYLGPVRQEFFDYEGVTYEVTTEGVWDGESSRDIRLFIELSDTTDESVVEGRPILEKDMISTPDGAFYRRVTAGFRAEAPRQRAAQRRSAAGRRRTSRP